MAKPLIASVVESPRVTVQTSDSHVQIQIDQAAGGSLAATVGTTLGLVISGPDLSITAPGGTAILSADLVRAKTTTSSLKMELDQAAANARLEVIGHASLSLVADDVTLVGGNMTPPSLAFSGADATLIAGGGGSVALQGADAQLATLAGTAAVVGPTVTVRTADSSCVVALDQGTTEASIEAAGVGLAIAGGNATVTSSGGNVLLTGSQVIAQAADVFVDGTTIASTTLWGLDNRETLASAAVNYDFLDQSIVPALNATSRLNIEANAVGTTIQSLFTGFNPVGNVDGRELYIQNTGTGALTLVNNSGTGFLGGLFFGATSLVILPGGGGLIMYDSSVTADGAWLIRAPA